MSMFAPTHDGAKPPGDYLSGDMTASDIRHVLEHLKFPGRDSMAVVELDRAVRDFILDCLRPPRR